MNRRHIFKWAGVIFGVWLVFFMLLTFTFRPSHDRTWELGHENLPYVSIVEGTVTISNYRNFDWVGPLEASSQYEQKSFLFSDITGVSVFISQTLKDWLISSSVLN